MSQTLIIEDYIAQTQKYREQYFSVYSTVKPTLGDFLAMPYEQQILAISEKLEQSPPSDELVSDYLAWVPREQFIIDNYNAKSTPFSGSWWPGGGILQFDTYTVASIGESVKIITVAVKEALINGSQRICGYIESVDDQKRWGYLVNCVDYDDAGQSVSNFLKSAVATISDYQVYYDGKINGTAISQDLSGVSFLRQGTCRAVLVRTADYVNPKSYNISGYQHNFSIRDGADFDMSHQY